MTAASAAPGPFYWIVKALLPFKHSKAPNANIVMQSKTNEGAMHWKIGGSGTLRKLENRHSHLCARAGANDTFVLHRRDDLDRVRPRPDVGRPAGHVREPDGQRGRRQDRGTSAWST